MSRCVASRTESPSSWLKAPFILPQWMSIYQEVGVHNFKVTGRTHPTDYIKSTVQSYLNRLYEGNLLGLWAQLESIWEGQEGQEQALEALDIPVELLDKFLSFFVNRKDSCSRRSCGIGCRYCDLWFESTQSEVQRRKESK